MLQHPFFLLFAALAAAAVFLRADAALPQVRIDSGSRTFRDEFGRLRVFRGMNAVYKVAPWHPQLTGFDAENSLSEIDARQLREWGFNIVRLGVMWPGVEPGVRGDYNQTYLDQLEFIVNTLQEQEIFVILDFHQDIWHRKFCGEGVPDYVFDICRSEESEDTAPFPLPVVQQQYPTDADGNPTLDSCLSETFAKYYLTAEVGAGFQCLYDNKQQLWDAFAGFWQQVAMRFRTADNVLGYELINEPWAGDVIKQPMNLLPRFAEEKYLQPLYAHLNDAIRAVDDEKIIFFEGLTIDYWRSGFTQGPGGSDYSDRQALSYHIYCPLTNTSSNSNNSSGSNSSNKSSSSGSMKSTSSSSYSSDSNSSSSYSSDSDSNGSGQLLCEALDDAFFALREADASRLLVPLLMTEFGAAEDFFSDLLLLERVAQLADKHAQSWMYWQYKYFQDITTITPQGESMFNADGSVCQDKLKVLSRTYPQALAASKSSSSDGSSSSGGFHFDAVTAKFFMRYTLLTTSAATSATTVAAATAAEDAELQQRTSEIYLNRALHYADGFIVELSGAGAAAVAVQCPKDSSDNLLLLVQQQLLSEPLEVEVSISRCQPLLLQKCSCQ